MGARGSQTRRAASRFVGLAYLTFTACCVLATCACTPTVAKADRPVAQPSMEILALSRGRGVPEATSKALQVIAATAESALESGSVVSVTRETIGLEGEMRLCILFRDQSALATVGDEIRELAADIDLLQIRVKDNNCSRK